jgi:hypothetical protein
MPVKLSDAILQEQASARQFPPTTPLRLGMKASYSGKEYELTGRQVMRQQDSDGVYTWEEWVLIAPDGDLLYLEFDEGKWKVSRLYTPQQPLGPDQLARFGPGSVIPLGNGALVSDHGEYRAVHAEGEFPYVVIPNRPVRFLDATARDAFYAVEWTEDAIEFYQGRYLDARQVFMFFGLHAEVAALDRQALTLVSRRRFGALCLVTSLVTLVMWMVALGSGRPVTNGTGTTPVARAVGEGVRFGPIPLAGGGRVHRLELNGSMREESNWVQAIVEDETEQELFASERDMWDESGSDSDGYWHESDLHASRDFVVRKPGNYYVRVYSEPDPGMTVGNSATVSFRLKDGVMYPLYLAIYGFCALLLGFGFLISGSPSTVQKLRESASSDDD